MKSFFRGCKRAACISPGHFTWAFAALAALTAMAGCDRGPTQQSSPEFSSGPSTEQAERLPEPNGDEGSNDVAALSAQRKAISDSDLAKGESESGLRFEQVARKLKLEHTYQNGAVGQLLMVESIGGAAGWLDLNHDGLLDLYCGQGGDAARQDPSENPIDQLYVQRPGGHFETVTEQAGVVDFLYGQGVAIADYNNDGFDDLFITNVGTNRLFCNNGDGTFELVAESVCSKSERWSSSAAWGDVDLDGDVDLYVCNYLKYDPLTPFPCEKDGEPALCHPRQLEAWPDEFYLNQGDGTFSSAAESSGLTGDGNKALGVVIVDLDGDQFPDIYVANDTTANFYFVNQHDGSFQESSLKLGGGLNADGAMQASMGIAAADFDGNGSTDLLLTHFTGESNTLYENLGDIGLYDVSRRTQLHKLTGPKLGFGTVMADFDANGQMDLLVANGHIDSRNADGDGFMQNPQLLSYSGGRWREQGANASDYFSEKHVGRAVALGDYDQDGDADALVVHQNEPLELLQNTSQRGDWLKIRPIARGSNRSCIGTSAVVESGPTVRHSVIVGGSSFAASHEYSLFFGLGQTRKELRVTVRWPGGKETVLSDVRPNQILTLVEPEL